MDYMIGIHITVIISVLLLIRLAFPRKFGNVPDYPGYDAVDAKDYLWKIESTQVGATYVIDLESPNGSVKLHKFAKMPYANGINLYDDFGARQMFRGESI